ncbi:MAG TPA: DNA-3-methyladenine glycosylase [Lacibacter sp.]|nr:DNA-3-methyladenine glycosylase [Lacibacter sp.]HMO88847.1 DNA-3-methyladenine glycosylase [Lacibacter sp.]HMP86692.1 DNA-3-methyladenine glycosylase [Lacibacter sp.]
MRKLDADFYLQDDVAALARQLLGRLVVHRGAVARIVETEAYAGEADRASHAWAGRRTQRTETLYAPGGTSYVYQCYGLHQLFNVVTNRAGIPHAVLIRVVEPLEGCLLPGKQSARQPGSGPALVSRVLGLGRGHNGLSLLQEELYLADDDTPPLPVAVSPRIGVDYAGAAARWLYRFFVAGHPHVTPHPFNQKALLLL